MDTKSSSSVKITKKKNKETNDTIQAQHQI